MGSRGNSRRAVFVPDDTAVNCVSILGNTGPVRTLCKVGRGSIRCKPTGGALGGNLCAALSHSLRIIIGPRKASTSTCSFGLVGSTGISARLPFGSTIPFGNMLAETASRGTM